MYLFYCLLEGLSGIVCFLEPVNKLLDKAISKDGKILKYIKGVLAISISVQIVIMPIMIYFYKTISFTFFIANILTRFFNQYNYNLRTNSSYYFFSFVWSVSLFRKYI